MSILIEAMIISIHALFAEGDPMRRAGDLSDSDISIHALFAEGDQGALGRRHGGNHNFYPRPLRRGRRLHSSELTLIGNISIHALFAEGDTFRCENG